MPLATRTRRQHGWCASTSGHYDRIAAGLKTATTCHRDPVTVGPALLVFDDDDDDDDEDDDGYRRLPGVIDKVESRCFDALTEEDARLENLSSADALRDGLRGHYPGIANDAIVDVVQFHLDRGTS